MDINSAVAIVSVIAGLITIIWFIRDTRKHNGLILESINLILKSIEEGQRRGFETLAQILLTATQILAKIEENTRR